MYCNLVNSHFSYTNLVRGRDSPSQLLATYKTSEEFCVFYPSLATSKQMIAIHELTINILQDNGEKTITKNSVIVYLRFC